MLLLHSREACWTGLRASCSRLARCSVECTAFFSHEACWPGLIAGWSRLGRWSVEYSTSCTYGREFWGCPWACGSRLERCSVAHTAPGRRGSCRASLRRRLEPLSTWPSVSAYPSSRPFIYLVLHATRPSSCHPFRRKCYPRHYLHPLLILPCSHPRSSLSSWCWRKSQLGPPSAAIVEEAASYRRARHDAEFWLGPPSAVQRRVCCFLP